MGRWSPEPRRGNLKPPEPLAKLLDRAVAALRAAEPGWAPGRFAGLAGELERVAAAGPTPAARRAELRELAGALRAYFKSAAEDPRENDGLCQVELTGSALRCYLTVFPPRRGGRQLSSEECFREIDLHQVTTGLDSAAVRRAVAEMQASADVICSVLVAEGRAPGAPAPPQLELTVPHLAKPDLRLDTRWLLANLPRQIRELKEGEAVGRYRAGLPGEPGITVRGRPLAGPTAEELRYELGGGLRVSRAATGELVTTSPGQLVVDARRAEVLPLFLVEGDYGPPSPEISFRGLVIVLGNLAGLRLDADEVIIAGNCEKSEVHSAGDVFVGGGVVGKREGRIFADGRVAARHVSDAEIEALGDVIVTNTITYSNVTSNARVVVTAERGAIVGGKVSALRGIEARSVGSDFGTYTVTAAGRDFLTARRLERLREIIRVHEDNLAKITDLKARLVKANVDVRRLPPEKQDIYLGVLRKEAKSQMELASLARRRDKLNQALADVLEATIRIREELFPPVRVEIADAIREIEEHLRGVVVFRDHKEGIVARQSAPGPGAEAADTGGSK